ncbi:MAG TPA: hypothetical protein VFZ61_30830, partial [Polyangiales bacterium]
SGAPASAAARAWRVGWAALSTLLCAAIGPCAHAAADSSARTRLYLSCPPTEVSLQNANGEACFESYLRQELSHFDFVRDPHLAAFTLVVVRQPAGNGGERFTGKLTRKLPMGLFETVSQRSFVAPPGAPPHSSRERLAQLLLRLLFAELAETPDGDAFELRLPPRDGNTLSSLVDPWDYWVFTPELKGTGEGGSGYYFAELLGALTVRRITDDSKFRVRGGYGRNLTGFKLEDGSRVRGDVYLWDMRVLYAHSVGRHGALGMIGSTGASEYENLAFHVHGGPSAEINVFPYADNATRQLRFAYQIGPWANWYFEPNVTGDERELRPYNALSMITDVNQPWGSIQWINQLNFFLDDPRKYRASVGGIVTLRLFEGFAISFEGEAAYVRDMINARQR